MRLAAFILADTETILAEWEKFARGISAAATMDQLALRDDAADILRAAAADMMSAQTAVQQSDKSTGHGDHSESGRRLNGASEAHAVGRVGAGFDLLEVVAEYRALRASVIRLWRESGPDVDPHDLDPHDLDDLTRFNESMDQSLTRAVGCYSKRVDESRDMFLAILGHDLRNPLNSIAMSATLLPHVGSQNAEAAELAARIAAGAAVMARMIGDLLDYTRTRLGAGMPMSTAAMDLEPLCREVLAEFRAGHPTQALRFRSAGDTAGEWDAARVRQAASNLLANAIQHGGEGGPVDLSLTGDGPAVLIAVRNEGPPIPPALLPTIFDPLVRGASPQSPQWRTPGSIGLGLYIAREVAAAHGGAIAVTSTDELGTTFTIRLPRRPGNRNSGGPRPDAG